MDPDAPFKFELIATPPDLADRINTLFVLETKVDRVEEILPAYSAQMVLMARGSAQLDYAAGETGDVSGAAFNAPMLQSSQAVLHGPVLCAGASLTPLGWASLADLPVDRVHDRVISPSEALPVEQAAQMERLSERWASGALDRTEVCAALGQIVRDASRPPRTEHVHLITETMAWLNSAFSPCRADLLARLPYEERQVQRLCKRFFGAPPATLLKRVRAIRAAALLSQPHLSDDLRNEIYLAYFDQAHLIRDIRRYTGRTPKFLKQHSLVTDTLDPEGHGPTAAIIREGLLAAR